MNPRQAVNQLQFNLDQPASPSNLVTRVAVNPQPVLIEKRPSALDPQRMELMSRLARRELQHSREVLDAKLPPGPKNVERRLHQGRTAIFRKAAVEQRRQKQQQQQQLPSRSHSPPVRDTDRAWRPGPNGGGSARLPLPRENAASMKRHEALELRRLREEVQQYAARMAELEAERLLGRGAGAGARRRPAALPFPTRPRSPRVGLPPPPQRQQQQQQRQIQQQPHFNPTLGASPPAVQAAASSASPVVADHDRARIVADVLAEIRRELGLRGGGGFSTPALSASAVSLIRSGAGSLAELRNIDHRLCQLEAEGDDIRDRWVAALAAGDEPICAADGHWRAEPPDGLRFVNNRNGARPAPVFGSTVEVAGARQPAALQLTQAEVQAIRSQRDRYRDYLNAGSSVANSGVIGFRPTQLTDAIAEQLLDDMLTDAADELLSASDAIVGHLVANETGVGAAEAAATAALSALGARAGGYSPTEEADVRTADYYSKTGEDGEDYGSQEFESEHSSDNGDSR